ESIPRTPKYWCGVRFISWARCPEGARGPQLRVQPLEACAIKRRALKGRKRGLVPDVTLNLCLWQFQICRPREAVLAECRWRKPPAKRVAGRFGIILRLPRVETLGSFLLSL